MLIRECANNTVFVDFVEDGTWSFSSRSDDVPDTENYQVTVQRMATGFRVFQLDITTNQEITCINSGTVFLIYSIMQNESFFNLICCDVNGSRRNTTIFHLDPACGADLFGLLIPMDWEPTVPNRQGSQLTQSL